MSDPGKIMQAQFKAGEVVRLRQAVRKGQSLLMTALNQRNAARAKESILRADVKSVANHWSFFLLPRWLKDAIQREVGFR